MLRVYIYKYTSQKRLTPLLHAVTSLRPCPPMNVYNPILRQNILTTHASGIRSPSTSASGVEPQKLLLSRLIANETASGYSIPPHVDIVSVFFLHQPGSPPFGALVAGVVSFEGRPLNSSVVELIVTADAASQSFVDILRAREEEFPLPIDLIGAGSRFALCLRRIWVFFPIGLLCQLVEPFGLLVESIICNGGFAYLVSLVMTSSLAADLFDLRA